jgi:excisionase family DNA binding protein
MTHHTERPIIEPNRVYSREEVAEVLNVSLSTIKRLIASGMLRVSSPVGMRRVLIRGQHILDLLDKTEVKPGEHKSDKVGKPTTVKTPRGHEGH